MNVELITIGDELLIGQVIDTNSAWMGKALNDLGFEVNRITSVRDTKDAITSSLKEAMDRVDVVLLTGGLGPTNDDITKHTLAEFFNTKLVFNEQIYEDVCGFLKGRVATINELNRMQAYVPESCVPIRNTVGTAPIMWFRIGQKVVVSMPGVPSEMKTTMTSDVLPRLKELFPTGHIIHQTILVHSLGESTLAELIADWEGALPSFISLAYLPSPGLVRLRLTARVAHEAEGRRAIAAAVDGLYPLIGTHIYGQDDQRPEELVALLMKQKQLTLAVAESCTGGLLGHLITSLPGSSSFFKGGVVAYANSVKEDLLGVDAKDLLTYGAVSQQVVEQMAKGVRQRLKCDYAIATSGIAGPDGGTEEKPVGTVWIAICGPNGVLSKRHFFGAIRERNIQRAASTALIELLTLVKSD